MRKVNSNSIKKIYNQKIKSLVKHNKLYFNDNRPIISDHDYDILKKEILDLEKNYKFLKNKNSPSKNVGFTPSKNFKKIKHVVPMLSLNNAFDREDLINFEKKIINFLNLKENFPLEYSVEPKIDGISASLTYKNGKFIQGLSRGDGKEGEDISENLKTIDDIPKEISDKNFPEEIDIRGEVFIQNSDFERLKTKFANPRNAASGSLRQKNPLETEKIPLKFIAYTYGNIKNFQINSQSDFIKLLKIWGFKTNELNKKIKGIDNLILNHQKVEKTRDMIDFDVDGLVYKINDTNLQKRLGFVANAPRWAIAHKFSANNAISVIEKIEIQVGRTGALTPVAKIRPVNIGGVKVSNATLHNEDEIIRKDIREGDEVIVERAGDVIPRVINVNKKKREKKSKKFIFPKLCPSCGSKTEKEFNFTTKKIDAVRRCTNDGFSCEKIAIEKIKHFVSKEAFNIDGFGKKIVEKFWDLKLLRQPQDIFKLNFKKIEKLEGWGALSVLNLRNSIEAKKKITFEKFIYSLGIRHIGQENAKLIAMHLKDPKNFLNLNDDKNFKDLSNIDGIGNVQINSIKNFFSNDKNIKVLSDLNNALSIENFKEINKKGKLVNKTFMLTGKLSKMSRAEAKSLIEQNSGKIISNVNKKLNYLIIGDKPTNRKIIEANDLQIKILNELEFFKMLNEN
tara:strand:+ start:458 stop:2494 length:2037 start_codon:yes stop_codon:yes gene_type:complete